MAESKPFFTCTAREAGRTRCQRSLGVAGSAAGRRRRRGARTRAAGATLRVVQADAVVLVSLRASEPPLVLRDELQQMVHLTAREEVVDCVDVGAAVHRREHAPEDLVLRLRAAVVEDRPRAERQLRGAGLAPPRVLGVLLPAVLGG